MLLQLRRKMPVKNLPYNKKFSAQLLFVRRRKNVVILLLPSLRLAITMTASFIADHDMMGMVWTLDTPITVRFNSTKLKPNIFKSL